MSAISPLSSPEYVSTSPVDRPNSRRLTQDLQEDVNVTFDSNPLTQQYSSWNSFFDKYSGDLVGIDQEELNYPFDPFGELLPLPSTIPRISPSSESYNSSSQDSYDQRNDTHTIQNDLMTPLKCGEVRGGGVLGDTLELGNCTYELDLNNLTSTLSKLSTTKGVFTSTHKQPDFDISSSTPLNNYRINITSDLITCDVTTPAMSAKRSIRTRMNFDNELFKSPIPSKSYLIIKPADSTVDLEVEDVFVSAAESVVTGTHPPCEVNANKESAVIIPAAKPSAIPAPITQPAKSALPVTTRLTSSRAATSSSRLLRGMRPASSTSSLPQMSGRTSLLPTSLKSRSHDRINAPAATRGFHFKK